MASKQPPEGDAPPNRPPVRSPQDAADPDAPHDRLRLVRALWAAGRREEALAHLQDLLNLDPADPLGARFILAGFFLFLDRDDDLARLLERYPDDTSAAWAYTRALLAFRQQGDTIDARRLLKKAKKANRHVPDYLLGRKLPPDRTPRTYQPGDRKEALHYVGSFLAGWKATPGAIAWVRAHDEKARKRKAEAPQGRGPLDFVKEGLQKRLPQRDDIWQADFRRAPSWVRIDGEPVRPWVILVTSRSQDLVLAHQVLDTEPSAALLWDTLAQAMQHPAAGAAHRPTELQVRPAGPWQSLRPDVEEIGVRLIETAELDQVDVVLGELSAHLGGQRSPGLLDVPGVTPEQMAGFYAAAAAFFGQAPWKKVGDDAVLRVECARFAGGRWYAVLMGPAGLTLGEDLAAIPQAVGTRVTFGEEWEIPVADLEAAQRYGWPVARSNAYPAVLHKEPGQTLRPPLIWELELIEGCLRALPDFVSRHPQDDPAREERTVPVTSGPLRLVLSWVGEEASGAR